MFKISTKSSHIAYLPSLWCCASLLNDKGCNFTHPVVKGWSTPEHHQACKTMWPVNVGRLICHYQNHLYWTTNHHDHTLRFFLSNTHKLKHNHNEPYWQWHQNGGWHALSIVTYTTDAGQWSILVIVCVLYGVTCYSGLCYNWIQLYWCNQQLGKMI